MEVLSLLHSEKLTKDLNSPRLSINGSLRYLHPPPSKNGKEQVLNPNWRPSRVIYSWFLHHHCAPFRLRSASLLTVRHLALSIPSKGRGVRILSGKQGVSSFHRPDVLVIYLHCGEVHLRDASISSLTSQVAIR